MILKRLELHNYRKFRELDLELPEGLVAIVGRNGMGKSTLIEAVAFALYGTVASRTGAKSIRREGAAPHEPCSVTLEFTVRNEPYRLVRKLTGAHETQEVALYRSGDPQPLAVRTKAVQHQIRKLLGMDYLTFTRSVLSRQKEINVLSDSTPGDRKKAIRRMLGIESIQTAIDAANAEYRDKTQWLRGAEEALVQLPQLKLQEEELAPRLKEARQHAEKTEQRVKTTAAEALAAEREFDAQVRKQRKDQELGTHLATTEAELRACGETLQEVRRQVLASEKASQEQRTLEPAEREFKELSQRKVQLDRAYGLHRARETFEQECQTLAGRLKELDVELRQARARVEKARNVPKEQRSAGKELEALKRRWRESQKTLRDAQKQLVQVETRAQDTRERVQQLSALGTGKGKCPTCHQKLGEGYREVLKRLEADARTAEAERKKQSAREKSAQQATSAAEDAVTRGQRRLDGLNAKLHQHREQARVLESLGREHASQAEQLKRKREHLKQLTAVAYDAREHQRVDKQLARLGKQHDRFERLGQEAAQLSRHQKRLKAEQARQEELRQREARIQQERRALGFEQGQYQAAKNKRARANELNAEARQAHANAQGPLATYAEQARALRQNITTLERDAERIRGTKEECLHLARLVELFKKFQVELISRMGPQIEESASRLLDLMTRGRYSRMFLDEDYKILIDDSGQSHALPRFSGGEEDLANLCLRIAISQLVAQRAGGNTSSLLVLDEVFGSQDIERRERILEALNRLQGMFQQIVLITHMEDIHERVPNMLRVLEDGARHASIAPP